jgi:hypothetical protein
MVIRFIPETLLGFPMVHGFYTAFTPISRARIVQNACDTLPSSHLSSAIGICKMIGQHTSERSLVASAADPLIRAAASVGNSRIAKGILLDSSRRANESFVDSLRIAKSHFWRVRKSSKI